MSSFEDLKLRVISAVVMIVIGVGAIWQGGIVFLGLLVVVSGLMIWELAKMLAPDIPAAKVAVLGVVAGMSVLRVGYDTQIVSVVSLLLAPIIGMAMLPVNRALFFSYALAILVAVSALFCIRLTGLTATLWLVLLVIASDVGGYFFGRVIGGPKIAPRISPKKTWSGTLGGWLLAAIVAIGFVYMNPNSRLSLIWVSVAVAIAAQIGDVVESAVKRHADIKDSSNLIPGHGGFLDRFDALIGAALFAYGITLLSGFRLPGGV